MIGAIEGYLEGQLNLLWRLLLAVIGVLLVWPNLSIWIRLVCVALFIAIFIYSGKRQRVLSVPIAQYGEQNPHDL